MIARRVRALAVWAAVLGLPGAGATARAQGVPSLPDSLFVRAQRLVKEGDGTRGLVLLDSLVRTNREGTNARAQALYWRATLAKDSTAAEGDYIAIVVDHALSPYAADALLHLGQIEYSRGSRSAAVAHFERLVLEHRASSAAADGWFWLGRARVENNDLSNGCVALDSAKRRIPAGNVELLNRVAFVAQPCRGLADARAAAAATPPVTSSDTVPPAKPPARRYSAQVGALKTSAEAERLVRSLKLKKHEARIDTLPPLFKVRIGSFASRAEAASLVSKLKREKIDAIVVEATRREP